MTGFDKKVFQSKTIRDFAMNGRHCKMTWVNALQYCMDLDPAMRSQVDYVFALREPINDNKQKLYKYFFGVFDNYEQFNGTMSACTENHECIVFDNTQSSNRVEDCVSWYKADPNLPDFLLGSDKFRRAADECYGGSNHPTAVTDAKIIG